VVAGGLGGIADQGPETAGPSRRPNRDASGRAYVGAGPDGARCEGAKEGPVGSLAGLASASGARRGMALGDRRPPSERLAMAVGGLAGDHGRGRAGSCSVSAKTPVSSRSEEPALAAGPPSGQRCSGLREIGAIHARPWRVPARRAPKCSGHGRSEPAPGRGNASVGPRRRTPPADERWLRPRPRGPFRPPTRPSTGALGRPGRSCRRAHR
jgi:hypothetical protein